MVSSVGLELVFRLGQEAAEMLAAGSAMSVQQFGTHRHMFMHAALCSRCCNCGPCAPGGTSGQYSGMAHSRPKHRKIKRLVTAVVRDGRDACYMSRLGRCGFGVGVYGFRVYGEGGMVGALTLLFRAGVHLALARSGLVTRLGLHLGLGYIVISCYLDFIPRHLLYARIWLMGFVAKATRPELA